MHETIDVKLQFPWPLICRAACLAMILGISFEKVVEQALLASEGRS